MQVGIISKVRKHLTKKTMIIGAVVLVLIIAAVSILTLRAKLLGSKAVTQRTAIVEKGSVDVAVTGSGPLTYTQTSNATTKVAGTITKLYFKEGDKVKAGDLLAEIDNKDAAQAVQDKQNSLTQSVISNSLNQQSASDLSVKTPITGQVSNIVASVGSNVNKGAAVLTVTDTSKLKLLLAFNGGDISKIKVGQTSEIYLNALMQTASGKVVYINNQTDTTSAGGQLVTVEIDLSNPGALLGGMTASADIETAQGTVSSAASGTLDYINKQIVTANASGTVDKILVKDGQKVSSGSAVVQLRNDDIAKNNELANLKIQSTQSQVDLAQKQLDDYKIYASIDGSIITQTLNVGDNVKANDTIATITDTNQIQFAVPIDELDIAKIALDQKVNVSVDALTETSAQPLEGVVNKVPFSGTSSNGVATFNVIVKLINGNEKLKSGMNANAAIQISNVDNVLRVPIEAVTKVRGKSYVWVKSSSGSKSNSNSMPSASGNNGQGTNGSGNKQNRSSGSNSTNRSQSGSSTALNKTYYTNAVMKAVEIGANNDSYVEIKSGLNEGDTIILPQLQTSTSTKSSTSQSQGQGFGGFGGGMGGGFTGGQNNGSNRNSNSSSGGARN